MRISLEIVRNRTSKKTNTYRETSIAVSINFESLFIKCPVLNKYLTSITIISKPNIFEIAGFVCYFLIIVQSSLPIVMTFM